MTLKVRRVVTGHDANQDGAEPLGSTPAEFGAFIRRELDKWGQVAEAAKIEKQ